jgi:hypothetical protein
MASHAPQNATVAATGLAISTLVFARASVTARTATGQGERATFVHQGTWAHAAINSAMQLRNPLTSSGGSQDLSCRAQPITRIWTPCTAHCMSALLASNLGSTSRLLYLSHQTR